MARSNLTLRLGLRWWVPWLVRLATFNAAIGIPVDLDRLTRIVLRHGVVFR